MKRKAMASRMEFWPVEKLKPYARNPRIHTTEHVLQIAASIKQFGFNAPILVDKKDGIVGGHGRYLAAMSIGMKEVPVVILDHLDEDMKRAYIIADNKLALNSTWDTGLLLEEISALNFDPAILGFAQTELDAMIPGEPDLGNGHEPEARSSSTIRISCREVDLPRVYDILTQLIHESGLEDVKVVT